MTMEYYKEVDIMVMDRVIHLYTARQEEKNSLLAIGLEDISI